MNAANFGMSSSKVENPDEKQLRRGNEFGYSRNRQSRLRKDLYRKLKLSLIASEHCYFFPPSVDKAETISCFDRKKTRRVVSETFA